MDLEEKGYAVIGHLTDTNLHYLSSLVRNNIGSESEDESNQNLKAGIFYAEESSIVRDTVFRKIIKEHNINVIADQYLKVKSKVIGCAAWLTSPTEHKLPVNAQNFHRDIDSIRWLKFFIYLTDVGPNNGPHIFVPTSHKNNVYKKYARLSEDDLNLKNMKSIEICGKAGTILAVDTYGIHRGKQVLQNERLLAQVTFGTLPVVYKSYPTIDNISPSELDLWSYYT